MSIDERPRGTAENPSIRQRKKLKKWAKGRLPIKVKEEQELMELGFIGCELQRFPFGCQTVYFLTKAGRKLLGPNAHCNQAEDISP